MRTTEEIKKQTDGLKKIRETLPEMSFFGDNNWEKLDAQIAIINSERFYEDFIDEGDAIESSAYDADAWLNANGESLIEGER